MDKKKNTTVIINGLIIAVVLFAGFKSIQYLSQNHTRSLEQKKNKPATPSAESLQPLDLEAHRIAADLFCSTGQPEKALPHFKRFLAVIPADRVVRFALASASLNAKKYEQALEEFSLLEEAGPTDSLSAKISARKGISLFYLNKITQARSALLQCLEQSPNMAEALCFLGQIDATEGDMKQALTRLEQAVSADPSYVEGWYQLARFKMERGDNKKALTLLQKSLELDPLNGKSHARLGMVHYYLNNKLQAKKSYLTAIALNPEDFNTRYNLGELFYTALADTESALREYKTTIEIKPDHVDANFKIGLICLRNNMVRESIRYFRDAVKNDPDNVRILLQLGVAYEKLGDREKALKVYRKVVAVDEINSIAIQKVKYLAQAK